jgi:hypothetical protein
VGEGLGVRALHTSTQHHLTQLNNLCLLVFLQLRLEYYLKVY